MPFRFTVGGISVECDEVREAAELISMLTKSQPPQTPRKQSVQPKLPIPGDAPFDALWYSIEPSGRDLLRFVAEAFPSQVEAEKLAPRLNTDANGVGWIRRKMNTVAEGAGVNLETWLQTGKVTGEDGKPKTAYSATRTLVEEIATVGT